jgi:hypothetical protein
MLLSRACITSCVAARSGAQPRYLKPCATRKCYKRAERAERLVHGVAMQRACCSTAADLQREQCCIGARCAQKGWRLCFGGSWGVGRIGDTRRQLCAIPSCSVAGKRCVTESSGGACAAVANSQREQYLSMGGRRRKSSASVSAANRVLAANGTLSSSFALSDHAQMLANGGRAESSVDIGAADAELQRERCCVGAGCAQECSAPVSEAAGVLAAYAARIRSCAL